MKKSILIAFATIIAFSVRAQVFTNGGFEYFGSPDTPANWMAETGGMKFGEMKLDSLEKYSGKYSARIASVETPMGNYAMAFITLPEHVVKDRKIEVRAMLKRDVADSVKTAIFVQKMMSDGTVSPPHYGEWHTGRGDWTETSLSAVVESPFSALFAGVSAEGQGTVWLDDFKVYADGELLDYAPRTDLLTESEKAWLKNHTYPLYPQMDSKIGDFIGDARIVGLGESTHGSITIAEARNQMIKSLVQDKGFSIITMEGLTDLNVWSANRYISEYMRDPVEAMAKGYQAPAEMRGLIEWLAPYCLIYGKKVRFMGTENTNVSLIIAQVDSLQSGALENELKTLRRVMLPVSELNGEKNFGFVKPVEFTQDQTDDIMGALAVCREWARQNMADAMDLDLMMHNLELIEKYIGLSGDIRDKIMADNIEWITRRYPDEKIVFLAHNGHVGYVENRGPIDRTGFYLRQKFGEDYYTVGACFYEGSYRAQSILRLLGVANDSREKYAAQPALPGSYEYLFNSISKPDFFLPLKGVAINKNSRWIAEPMQFRSTGAIHESYGFSPTSLPEQFDAVVFIRESKSTVQ